ncbi:variant erythrocyte surface antigen-1 family protein [Babesia caballi]|uniref:Variant erythrocyte surface antigen-1 family protein n=1 Tax=Babesia caballi TaxID=5871 RepID=A0AAV4LNK4_BABCB|nr:variant erythrocyte surface antigen-1 family protein [Babesia caballi]
MVDVQKSKLTEPPTNLKEAIDWLLCVFGYGGKISDSRGKTAELAKYVEELVNWNGLKSELKMYIQLEGLIGNLANGLRDFLGYYSTTSISNSGIVQSGYQSTYKDASWPNDVGQQEECAKVFLGVSVVTYYCIGYLYWRLNGGGWKNQTVAGVGIYLKSFLNAMGYNDGELNNTGDGHTIMNKVAWQFEELENAPSSGNNYSKFFEQLEKIDSNKALNRPLASCFKLATEYFKSQNTNATEVTDVINNLKTKFEELSKNQETSESYSSSNPYDDLKQPIKDLLSQAANFKLQEPSRATSEGHGAGGASRTDGLSQPANKSSHAAPVAGTLTTLGLGGGAAAAYMFNIGGAKTLVNGLLKIG